MAQTPEDLLNEARQSVPELTAEQAKTMLERGEIDLLLDVREPSEWTAGHIPGAIHAPRGMLEWYADSKVPYRIEPLSTARQKQVVIYCAIGGRSLLAGQTLQRLGFENVASMAGGMVDWTARGFPVER